MSKSRFTEEQMVAALREADRTSVAETAKSSGPLVPHRCPGICRDEVGSRMSHSTYENRMILDVVEYPETSKWPARRDSNPRHPT